MEEMLPEYDFKSMRPIKMGKGRKSWYGTPNPDYDPAFDPRFVAPKDMSFSVGAVAADERDTPMVRLDADVAEVFADAVAVNSALRFVIKITNENPLAARQTETAAS